MRHGEASWQAPVDSDRPLSKHGVQQVQQQAIGSVIDWQGFAQLLASPYLRTQQTSQLLQQYLGTNWPQTNSSLLTPDSHCDAVQELLLTQPQVDTVIVTHQPLISCLIGHFCHGDIMAGEPMMPASVALLSGPVFARQCMQLENLVHVN
jgi:phosphohistidine phosphatase